MGCGLDFVRRRASAVLVVLQSFANMAMLVICRGLEKCFDTPFRRRLS